MPLPPDPRPAQVVLALKLLAIDPGLGGLWLRARPSPVRDDVLALAEQGFDKRLQKLPPNTSDETLFGGLDAAVTLASGTVVRSKGLFARKDRPFLLTQAQMIDASFAARISGVLDQGAVAIACDEGVDDEGLSEVLQDRLAFHFDLEGLRYDALLGATIEPSELTMARALLSRIGTDDLIAPLTEAATGLGISSLRAVQFALRAAKAHALLCGRTAITDEDIRAAIGLVYSPRITALPEMAEPETETPEPESSEDPQQSTNQAPMDQDQMIEAVKAQIASKALLEFLQAQTLRGKLSGQGAGAAMRGNRRGRPVGSRPGSLEKGARLDVLATMRRAVPFQKMRAGRGPIALRKEDFAIKRFESKSDRLLVFSVDASGSAAAQRLAEAKGAIEALLAEAYARRDHVALVAFRKDAAEVLLPPTRSLVQAKRRLCALPGGGGTPLASGLQSGFLLALAAKKRGMTPAMILLSDGGANIALDGSPGRTKAQSDAEDMARFFASEGLPTMTIDTGRRPDDKLRKIAGILGGGYMPLPNANSDRIGATIKSSLLGA